MKSMERQLKELLDVNGSPYSPERFDALRRCFGAEVCSRLGLYIVPEDFLLSVVIPVYNEVATLQTLVDRVSAVPVKKEIILVDDCSSDGSREILRTLEEEASNDPQNQMRVVYHEQNQGKGAALRTGFSQVSGDVVLVQDADLEYNPDEYLSLLRPIIEGRADVVFGSRFLGDRPHRVLYFWHFLGNRFLTMLSNCMTNLNLTDMETCYKVFRRSVIDSIAPTLRQNRFGFEPEVTAKVAKGQHRVYETSVSYDGRTYEHGKKIGWRDGVAAIWCIIRYRWGD